MIQLTNKQGVAFFLDPDAIVMLENRQCDRFCEVTLKSGEKKVVQETASAVKKLVEEATAEAKNNVVSMLGVGPCPAGDLPNPSEDRF